MREGAGCGEDKNSGLSWLPPRIGLWWGKATTSDSQGNRYRWSERKSPPRLRDRCGYKRRECIRRSWFRSKSNVIVPAHSPWWSSHRYQSAGTCLCQAHLWNPEKVGLLGNSNTCDPADLGYLRLTIHDRMADEEPETSWLVTIWAMQYLLEWFYVKSYDQGLLRRSRSEDSMPSLSTVWVQSLVWELRSHRLCCTSNPPPPEKKVMFTFKQEILKHLNLTK